MPTKRGIPVSPGIAIQRAVVIDAEDVAIPRRTVSPDAVANEHQRLDQALSQSLVETEKLRDQAQDTVGDLARIFDPHVAWLQDKYLIGEIKKMIDTEHVTAEYAAFAVMRTLAATLRKSDSVYLRERDRDIWDLERRIIGQLIGGKRAGLGHLDHQAVVIAHDLTPSQTASLDKSHIKAIATDAGGPTSHTAILAHALGIPAIVGLEEITSQVNTGDMVIIDGHSGTVIVNPDAAQLLEYRTAEKRMAAFEEGLGGLAKEPAVTKDGAVVEIHANIEFPSEIAAAVKKGAAGIGLYRTEFLYLESAVPPTEQQQYDAYTEALQELAGLPLTIRTLDLGADKIVEIGDRYMESAERNPFLGCRSIRLCLQNLPLFKTQLRACLRASVAGPMRIMFPLISNIMELRQAKMILGDVQEDLEEQGLACRPDIPVGIMIEVPSAALRAAVLNRETDFFSIGTNDLIQYATAVDRGNERVAYLFEPFHPGVLRMIQRVIEAGHTRGLPVALCGEMSANPLATIILLGMGLDEFSMSPMAIPHIKKVIRSVSLDEAQRITETAFTLRTGAEVRSLMEDVLKNKLGELEERV